MSWYYTYYLCYEKEGKIFPLGPFDAKGQFYEVLERSRSFASAIHESFWPLKKEQMSEEFLKCFPFLREESWESNLWSYRYLKDLPTGSPMKRNYYLLDDIAEFLEDGSIDDKFYDFLSPEAYALKLQNELQFGPPKEKLDDFGDPYTPHSCADYALFNYEDWLSEEYEAQRIREAASVFNYSDLIYDRKEWKQINDIVVVLRQG